MVNSNKLLLGFVYTIVGAIVWSSFRWAYSFTFQWSEYVPGINFVYLPHGLSMILVVLFGFAGGLGVSIATAITGWAVIQANPELGWCQTAVAGLAAYASSYLVLGPVRHIAELSERLNGRALIMIAVSSSITSSAGHVFAWYWFDAEAVGLTSRFINMTIGDFFGAMFLLYLLKLAINLLEKRLSYDN